MKLLTLLILFPTLSFASLKASVFDIKPWGYYDEKGNPAGIEVEVIQAISEEMKEKIDITVVPYKRMIHQLKYGQTDFAIFFKSEKSMKIADPIAKWGELDIIVIGLKGQKIKNYNDLYDKKIGVILGGYFSPVFDNDKKLIKQSFANYEDSIISLKKGKIDLIIGTAATLYYEFEKQDIEINKLSTPYHISKKEDWLQFSKISHNQSKREQLKNAINNLIDKKVFSQIFSKYLPKKWQHK